MWVEEVYSACVVFFVDILISEPFVVCREGLCWWYVYSSLYFLLLAFRFGLFFGGDFIGVVNSGFGFSFYSLSGLLWCLVRGDCLECCSNPMS